MCEGDTNTSSLEPLAYEPGATTVWNSSWRQLFDRFGDAILAYARCCGLNEHSAEDVLQEVMMTLIRCQHGQEPGYDRNCGSFQAWLWGVIRNRTRSVRRKDQKEPAASLLPAGESDGTGCEALPEIPAAASLDVEKSDEDQWQRALLTAALRKVQERITPQNFAIYAALLEERATPEELSRTYGKQTNAIYAVKHRCDKLLLGEAQLLRAAWERLARL